MQSVKLFGSPALLLAASWFAQHVHLALSQGCTIVNDGTASATLAKGRQEVDEWCANVEELTDDELVKAKETLEDAGGDLRDMLYETLDDAADAEEFQTQLGEKFQDSDVIGSALGQLVFAALFYIMMFYMCYQCCPCCRCCRRQKKAKKNVMLGVKCCVAFYVLFFLVCCIVAVHLTIGFAGEFRQGCDSILCTSGELAIASLGGNNDDWLGLIGTTDFMIQLNNKMAVDSKFMENLTAVLTNTVEIETAMTITTSTMSLMGDTIARPENAFPRRGSSSSPQDGYHECYMCTGMGPIVESVVKELDDGFGAALAEARKAVEDQLTGAELDELRNMMCNTTQEAKDAMDMLANNTDSFMDFPKDSFEAIVPFWMAGSVIALVAMIGVFISMLIFAVKEPSFPDRGFEGERNPYSWCSGCGSCWTWFWTCWSGITFMWMAGILVLLSVPLSGFCLVLTELTAQQLTEWGPKLLDMDEDAQEGWNQVVDIFETCLLSTGDGDLLNALVVDGVTMKEKLQNEIVDTIDAAFADALDQEIDPLATSQEYIQLKEAMSIPVDQMTAISQSGDDIFTQPNIVAMPASLKHLGYFTTMSCNDTTSAAEAYFAHADSFSGIDHFVNEAAADPDLQYTGPVLTCQFGQAPFLLCSPATTPNEDGCDAVNEYIDVKFKIMDANSQLFRCDVFTVDDLTPCDVYYMEKVNGVWVNDCVRPDGTLKPFAQYCNYGEFLLYVSRYAENNTGRLDKVANRFDQATVDTQSAITDDMYTLVDTEILTPVDGFINTTMCKFTQEAWDDFLSGICYQTIAPVRRLALSYAAFGWFAMLGSLGALFMFRWTCDNYAEFKPRAAPEPAQPVVVAQVIG